MYAIRSYYVILYPTSKSVVSTLILVPPGDMEEPANENDVSAVRFSVPYST